MATRRNVKVEENEQTKDSVPTIATSQPSKALNIPGAVVVKLLLFTLAMITAPLLTYYISVTSVFVGNVTVAGAFAAVAANVVLIAYIIVAMNEDDTDEKDKKSQ